MADIPYRCEAGAVARCIGGADETLLSQVQYFQTFVEMDKVINGTQYNVLYGGIQWGYSYSNVDTPEPSSLLLIGSILAAAGLRKYLSGGAVPLVLTLRS
jgi:hypothetical protein